MLPFPEVKELASTDGCSKNASHNKSLELTGERPSGSGRLVNDSDQVDLIRACSSTLCSTPKHAPNAQALVHRRRERMILLHNLAGKASSFDIKSSNL